MSCLLESIRAATGGQAFITASNQRTTDMSRLSINTNCSLRALTHNISPESELSIPCLQHDTIHRHGPLTQVHKLLTVLVHYNKRKGLGPDRYIPFRYIPLPYMFFDKFEIWTTSVRVSRVPRRYIPLRYIVLTTSVQPLRYNATSVHYTPRTLRDRLNCRPWE